MRRLFAEFRPGAVMHLAAESHVDRSIYFIGRIHQDQHSRNPRPSRSRASTTGRACEGTAGTRSGFMHVSTDEVYGTLGDDGFFTESTRYDPSHPIRQAKPRPIISSRAWQGNLWVADAHNELLEQLRTLSLPRKAHSSHHPQLLEESRCRSTATAARCATGFSSRTTRGRCANPSAGHRSELQRRRWRRANQHRDRGAYLRADGRVRAGSKIGRHASLIRFVADRPGHDWRYAIDSSRIRTELGWAPVETFESGLACAGALVS